MNTIFLLMAEFETTEIPLSEVAPKFFGLDEAKAGQKARTQSLPVPVYRGGSQKSQWLVSVQDLAAYLDGQKAQARKDWERINGSKPNAA